MKLTLLAFAGQILSSLQDPKTWLLLGRFFFFLEEAMSLIS